MGAYKLRMAAEGAEQRSRQGPRFEESLIAKSRERFPVFTFVVRRPVLGYPVVSGISHQVQQGWWCSHRCMHLYKISQRTCERALQHFRIPQWHPRAQAFQELSGGGYCSPYLLNVIATRVRGTSIDLCRCQMPDADEFVHALESYLSLDQ
jgi:hypothetical protein